MRDSLRIFRNRKLILAFLQARVVQCFFDKLVKNYHCGFFQRIIERRKIGKDKLEWMSKAQGLSLEEIEQMISALIATENISLNEFIQKLPESIERIQRDNQALEDHIRQQFSPLDKAAYLLHNAVMFNYFIQNGLVVFAATEEALKSNLPLTPPFVIGSGVELGLINLVSTFFQPGASYLFLLSVATQIITDLEFSTMVGSLINQPVEKTLRFISKIGCGFSLKDLAQFCMIFFQTAMELNDRDNSTMLRVLMLATFVFSLTKIVAGYIAGMNKQKDKSENSHLEPMKHIIFFLAAMSVVRFMSYGLNIAMNWYDAFNNILTNEKLCKEYPEQCKKAAWDFFGLPKGAGKRAVKVAFRATTTKCHPDSSSLRDTNCLDKARLARKVLFGL